MATFKAKITSKGQITLPSQLRKEMRAGAGDTIVFTEYPDGSFRIDAMNRSFRDMRGIVKDAPPVSSRDIARWIEDARGRAVPPNLNPGARKRARRA